MLIPLHECGNAFGVSRGIKCEYKYIRDGINRILSVQLCFTGGVWKEGLGVPLAKYLVKWGLSPLLINGILKEHTFFFTFGVPNYSTLIDLL